MISILDALDDPYLFDFRDQRSWASWRAFLAVLFGLPLTPKQLALYRECTGRDKPSKDRIAEAWLIIGRRGGKSFILAVIAVYLATFIDWRKHLGPGEYATVMAIAADRKQARTIMRYCRGLLQSSPMLAKLVEGETQETISLAHRVIIEVHTASFRSTRGYTIVAALCDELAFWPTEDSSDPDYEVLNAIRPGMATIPNALLLCASSPYAQKGALHDAYRKHYGRHGDPILIWQAPTRTMNPTVPQTVIDQAIERDPASASSEYLAQFRHDVESFVSVEAIKACISQGVHEREPLSTMPSVIPSGGVSDSMTLAIGHRENRQSVIDCVREVKPPFSPVGVVSEFATLLKRYRCSKVLGDRYAGEWPRERFREYQINYEPAAKPKSDLYRDLLPIINSHRIDLLDHPRLVNQLIGLERRPARSGRDSIDHAPGGHDDVANAVAGVADLTIGRRSFDSTYSWVGSPDPATYRAMHRNGWDAVLRLR